MQKHEENTHDPATIYLAIIHTDATCVDVVTLQIFFIMTCRLYLYPAAPSGDKFDFVITCKYGAAIRPGSDMFMDRWRGGGGVDDAIKDECVYESSCVSVCICVCVNVCQTAGWISSVVS